MLLLWGFADQILEIRGECRLLLHHLLVDLQIRGLSRHQITPVGIFRFAHRGIDVIQELNKIMTATIQPPIGQQDARIVIGDRADDQNPNEHQAETG